MKKLFHLVVILIVSLVPLRAEGEVIPVDLSPSKTYIIDKQAGMIDQNIQELTFIHTSDIHGYAFQREILHPDVDEVSGGIFSLATLIAQKRKEIEFQRWSRMEDAKDMKTRRSGDGIFLVDCGDSVSGTYNDSLRVGEDITRLMNSRLLDYDVKTIGNHSADYGAEAMFRNIGMTNFPVVIANALETASGKQIKGTRPYIIKESYGIKVGFIGLSHSYSTRIDGVTMSDEIATLEKYLPEIRERADIVVCVSHLGIEQNAELIQKLKAMDDADPTMNVDIFLDGHSHGNIHFMIDEDTVVTQAGKYGEVCGEVKIRFNHKLKKIATVTVRKHSLKANDLVPSQKLKNEFRDLVKQVEKENKGVVEEGLPNFFMESSDRSSAYIRNPASEFCARSSIEVSLGQEQSPDCSIVYQKSVRNHVASNDAGIVTNDIIHWVLPFEENMKIVRVSGEKLQEIVTNGMKKKFSWAGLRAYIVETVEQDKLVERKLNKLEIFDKTLRRFVPVEKEKQYLLTCNEFFSRVYVKPLPADVINTSVTDKSVLKEFIRKYKTAPEKYFTDLDPLAKSIVYETGK